MNTLSRILKWENARALFAILFLCGLTAETLLALRSPSIPLLPPLRGGTWIRPGWPTKLVPTYGETESVVFYRKRLVVPGPPRDIVTKLAAFRDAAVFVDRLPIPIPAPLSWKDRVQFTLPSGLFDSGPHELLLRIGNRLGPPLFHLSSDLPGLGDPEGWEFSQDGLVWAPAERCDKMMSVELRSMFPTVAEGLGNSLLLLLPLFAGFLAVAALKPRWLARISDPDAVRVILLALWALLGMHNMFRLPINVGFDAESHAEYIAYLLRYHRIPTAAEGVQMFQPPLYYLLAAVLYRIFSAALTPETSLFLLRVIPLACGLLLIDLTARTLRTIYPDRKDLQSCGLLVAGLLPMNLYMCQHLGNEPLTAVLTALLLYRVIATFRKREPARWKDAVLLGAIGGLAMIAKVTPLVLVPLIVALILCVPGEDTFGIAARLKFAGLFVLTAGVVSGWFYARNWILFGKPFLGGWDPLRNLTWWQDPGYRTIADFVRFGEALRQPIYSAFNGFADGLYSTFWSDGYLSGMAKYSARPGWNFRVLAAALGLSVVPAAAIGAGVGTAFWRTAIRECWPQTFLLGALFAYVAALVHLFVSLPIYSTAKATYLMGLTPAFGVLAAAGAAHLSGRKYVGLPALSLIVTWGAATYIAFFVR